MSRQYSGSSGVAGAAAPAQAGLWSYAVPADETQYDSASRPAPVNTTSSSTRPRQTPSGNTTTLSRPKTRGTSKSIDGLNQAYGASALKPPVREQTNVSGEASEADSLLDLYKPSRENLKAASREQPRIKRKGSRGAEMTLNHSAEGNEDKWIHRDKLQQIEIQEMIAAGRVLDYPSRSASRTGAKPSQNSSVDLDAEGIEGSDLYSSHENKRQRLRSPRLITQELAEEKENFPEVTDSGSSPTESSSIQTYHPRRPSTSRIPVKGGSISDDSGTNNRSHNTRPSRSGSQGSQNMLDMAADISSTNTTTGTTRAYNVGSTPTSPPGSPLKQRKTANATRGRSVSRGGKSPQAQTRPRTASSPANGIASRPTTSNGSRPTTARPEGDPPWMNNMYKPDPRLPPDQQMLPTHARRLAEQKQMQALGLDSSSQQRDDVVLLDDDEGQSGKAVEDGDSQDLSRVTTNGVDRESRSTANNSPTKNTSQQADQNGLLEPRKRDSLTSQKRNSLRSEERHSANAGAPQENGQWPLRTLSFNKYAPERQFQSSPKTDSGSFNQTRPNPPSETGSYSLMPTIHGQKEMEQRMSQRSGMSNATPSSTHGSVVAGAQATPAPIRLPEEPETTNEKKEKGGCAGCCVVM